MHHLFLVVFMMMKKRIEQNIKKSIDFFKLSHEQGDPKGLFKIGLFYEQGKGGKGLC